jgi:hypothetical protein
LSDRAAYIPGRIYPVKWNHDFIDMPLIVMGLQEPKTANAMRTIDLHVDVAHLLKQFIAGRTEGFVFQTRNGKPLSQSNILKRHLHPILGELGISKRGLHAFRRFRNTYLRSKKCPEGLVKYWMGHAPKDMTDLYDHIEDEIRFRQEVASEIGVGFEVPKRLQEPSPFHRRPNKPSIVPIVPKVDEELVSAND